MSDAGRTVVAESVSRETLLRLDAYVSLLRRWQGVKNLVAPSTLDEVWSRHIADSLQLAGLAPRAGRWIDIGSGAGFPGLVLAIAASQDAAVHFDLIESNARKCAFLREVVRLTGAPAEIHAARIEDVLNRFVGATAVTARALAPLSNLLDWTKPLLTTGTIGLFPKGRDAEAELTQARERWRFEADLLPSRTASDARIVRVTSLADPAASSSHDH